MTRRHITALLLALGVFIVSLPSWSEMVMTETAEEKTTGEYFLVTAVIDGDTIEVIDEVGKRERVRYIGIDTPEFGNERDVVECLAQEAMLYNQSLVAGQQVALVSDVEDRDKYGRWLRYVSVSGSDVGASLLRAGYATTLTIPPNVARSSYYKEVEAAAYAEAVGLWGERCHKLSL